MPMIKLVISSVMISLIATQLLLFLGILELFHSTRRRMRTWLNRNVLISQIVRVEESRNLSKKNVTVFIIFA